MIYTYIDHRKKAPFLNFFKQIKETDHSMWHKTCDILKQMDNQSLSLKPPQVKTMLARTGLRHVYKLRLGHYRLFFIVYEHDFYLLHAFKKTSQTTPEKEIKKLKKELRQATFVPLATLL